MISHTDFKGSGFSFHIFVGYFLVYSGAKKKGLTISEYFFFAI